MSTKEKLQAHLASAEAKVIHGRLYRENLPRIACGDGTTMSVQASSGHYCSPRDNAGPWHEVEVGYPSCKLDALMPYIDGDKETDPTNTVYGYVPLPVLVAAIDERGGFSGIVSEPTQ